MKYYLIGFILFAAIGCKKSTGNTATMTTTIPTAIDSIIGSYKGIISLHQEHMNSMDPAPTIWDSSYAATLKITKLNDSIIRITGFIGRDTFIYKSSTYNSSPYQYQYSEGLHVGGNYSFYPKSDSMYIDWSEWSGYGSSYIFNSKIFRGTK
jgi:hypothetical protein